MKLIRLEWKKINPAPYLGTALGLLALSMLIALLFCFLPESEWGPAQMSLSRNWHFLILLVSCVTLFSYTMLGAVLSSRVILTEFLGKNKLLVFLANQPQTPFCRQNSLSLPFLDCRHLYFQFIGSFNDLTLI